MAQIELNKKLLQSAIAPECDLSYIEKLLSLGAEPLGKCYENDDESFVIDELFSESQDIKIAKRLPDIVELFLSKGMDINKKNADVLYCLT